MNQGIYYQRNDRRFSLVLYGYLTIQPFIPDLPVHPFHKLRASSLHRFSLPLLTSDPVPFAPVAPLLGFSNFHRRFDALATPLFIRVLAGRFAF